jgi:catechol 2,3-dioxygenase-like lactoylglutathione lyase family enzyme
MITGLHAIVFSPAAEKVRAFFTDVLGMPSVDAGGGWLIFALPPAELAVHPADGDTVRRARRRPGRRAGWGHRAGPGRRRP